MPSNTVLAIVQDHSGYLWLGTTEGLVRFDGANFATFGGEQNAVLRSNFINNLYVDRRGILWIGTNRGHLLSLEQREFRIHSLDSQVSSISPSCLAEDGQGNLWIGTSNGLFYRPPAANASFKKYPEFPNAKILCLVADRSGRILFSAKNKGLYRLENNQPRRVLPNADRAGNDVLVLRQCRNGDLWLGTERDLYLYRDKRMRHYPLKPGLGSNVISLLEDRDGNLWIGSEGGLYCFREGRFQLLSREQGFSSNYVYSLWEDKDGSLWVGTVEGGLIQLRDEKITVFGRVEELSFEFVRCIHGDATGAVWVSGYGGYLSRFQGNDLENFRLGQSLNNSNVLALELEADGSFWLGSERGLHRFQNNRLRNVALPAGIANTEIRCVCKDRSGRLWIGTLEAGLLCHQGGRFTVFSAASGFPDKQVNAILQDRRGDLWIGSEGGVIIARHQGGDDFSFTPVLRNCQVISFHEDNRGVMWVGTRRHGLKVFADGRWGSLKSDQGLFDNQAYTILEDDMGYLWLSSERGIFRARKRELEKAAFDPTQRVGGRLFDENDGMKSRICNHGQPASWKSADGRLWFATINGVASVDPANIHWDDHMPPVLLEEIVVDDRDLTPQGASGTVPLRLAAGSKRFEFKYTALSFIRSNKIEFKYRLDGYDRDWIDAGNRRQAFYNNLRPGHYRFRVIAANADGVWNTTGASFAFYLRPFIYQTWWFLVLAALAFSVLSGLSWQLLKKYLRAVSFWKKKTQIGHFKILETIGSGGMATVYKAQDLFDRKRIVALKVLKEENFHDEAQKKRFKHESLITEQLDHPHIVHIIERGEMEDCWYIAMELLQGISLARMIKEGGRLPLDVALDIMRQVVDALQAIHGKNIVHRDLKPENIMVSDRDGPRFFVKLLDFGLAITPAQSRLTMSGVVMGTIRYLPPERIHEGVSSVAGDIYSAGIIFYEMLTAAKPFWSEATGEVIHRILETYPLSAGEINPAIPPELDALIKAMIDKDPRRRPSLGTIEAELRRLAEMFPPQN